MTDPESIPRYRVRLPDGEVELDAIEIVRRFRNRELFTSTEVRPAGGGDWCEIRFDPVLANVLAKPYRNLSRWANPWWRFWQGVETLAPVLILPLMLLLWCPFSSCLSGWQLFLVLAVFPWLFVLAAYFPDPPVESAWKNAFLMVPYWNCWAGWRRGRECVSQYAEPLRRRMEWLNSGVWLTWTAFLAATWWAPPTVAGGAVVWGLLVLFFAGILGLSLPLYRDMWRKCRTWRQANPPLAKEYRDGTPLPEWSRAVRRREWRMISGAIMAVLLIEVLALTAALLPYYVIGKIRLEVVTREAGSAYPMALAARYPEIPEPHAAPALAAVALPPYPCPDAALAAAELPTVLPKLEQFRAVLRAYPHLGAESTNEVAARIGRLMHYYLEWRTVEMMNRKEFDDPAYDMDLARIQSYLLEAPQFGYRATIVTLMRGRWIEARLPEFSDSLLEELGNYFDGAEAGLRRNWKNCLWLESLGWTDMFPSWLLVPFRDNIRTTTGWRQLEQIRLLEGDYYQHHAANVAFHVKYDGYGGIYWLFYSDPKTDERLAFQVARLRVLRTLVACEEYRRKYGAYPETLAALTPEFLEAVPLDPFDGKPLRYDPGRTIYSVGANGIDDGGDIREFSRADGWKDIGFALSPTQEAIHE